MTSPIQFWPENEAMRAEIVRNNCKKKSVAKKNKKMDPFTPKTKISQNNFKNHKTKICQENFKNPKTKKCYENF